MSPEDRLFGADHLLAVLRRYGELLVAEEDRLNRINVFPIADHDTGTNLRRTIDHLVSALDEQGSRLGWEELGSVIAAAAPGAAAGRSGLLVSEFLVGLATDPGAHGHPPPDGSAGRHDLAAGLCRAAASARGAVTRPVEGTLLSVGDAVAQALVAGERPPVGGSAEVAERAHRVATEALVITPSQLSVLAVAGVVDAGAAGLALFYRALADVMAGGRVAPGPVSGGGTVMVRRWQLGLVLDGPPRLADQTRAVLAEHGTELSVSWSGDEVSVRLHAEELGPVIEALFELGRPRNLVVEPLVVEPLVVEPLVVEPGR
jgi:hypothetical protein